MSTPSILEKIVAKKKQRVEETKAKRPIDEVLKLANSSSDRPSFYDAVKKDGLSIIGEIKKASPSKGLIRADFNPEELAKQYAECVDAISVLTEEDFFMGSAEYLTQAADASGLPSLRKDFIIDEYQIIEAKALGASAILLIASVLHKSDIERFIALTHDLNMDALVETHSLDEAKKSLDAGAKIIGINNRDLNTFDVSLDTTLEISSHIPKGILKISESGFFTGDDIIYVNDAGIDGVLVGESFMKCSDINAKALEFKNAYKS